MAAVPASTLGMLAALLTVAGLGIWCIVVHRRLHAALGAEARARGRADAATAMLNACPVGYLTLSRTDDEALISPGLSAALGLRNADRVHLSAVLGVFDKAVREQLATAVRGLRAQGKPFALELVLRDRRRAFDVIGRRVSPMPDGAADVLWFCDETSRSRALHRARADCGALSAMVDGLGFPVWRRDSDLRLIYCNHAYSEAVDRDRDTVIADGIELVGATLSAASRSLAARARDGGTVQSETHHVVVAGARRLLELFEHPLDDGTLAGYALDQTALEELEGELSRHVDAHAEVLEHLGTAIAIFGPDMRVKFYNSAYAQLWRLDESFLDGEPHMGDVFETLRERRRLPEYPDFPAFKRERLRLFSTLIERYEDLEHLPDGSTMRMVVIPHPFGGVLSTFEDVTDRLALERSYNTLIAVQRETLDKLYEGVAVYGSNGRLKLYNPAFAHMWQLPKERLESEPHARDLVGYIRDYFNVSDDAWPALAERIVARATDLEARTGRLERADGSVLDYAQVPLPDGASLFTYLDVTDSIRVERALRERNEALETADRLKSEFLANVSYELRTPLNAIVGFAEILENQYFGKLNKRQNEYCGAIVESSQRLMTLINDILDLASVEAGYMHLDLQTVDVHNLLEGVYILGHERARNGKLDLVLDCPQDIGSLSGDERRLKQALFNLLSNSFKFTPAGGAVTLSARSANGDVLLAVSDTGIGISREDRARVFGKFERRSGQGRQSGAGLGLSLVKSLIELHGGWVELDSEPDRGTRVTCHVPRTPQAHAEGRWAAQVGREDVPHHRVRPAQEGMG